MTTTALLFAIPKHRRAPGVLRLAILRRLDALMPEGGFADDYDWNWSYEQPRYDLARRLEKLLRCVENKIAPDLAARRDELAVQAEANRKQEQLQREIDAERRADAINAQAEADPKVAELRAVYDAANAVLLAAIAAEYEAEAAMLAAPFAEKAAFRKMLIPLRGKVTRAQQAASRAHSIWHRALDYLRRDLSRRNRDV